MLELGEGPAATSMRANYSFNVPKAQAQECAHECVKFLKVSGVWDRIMLDSLKFRLKLEQAPGSSQTDIHSSDIFWKTLPLKKQED